MRRILIAGGLVIVLALGAAAGLLYRQSRTKDVRGSPTLEFATTESLPPKVREGGVVWPTYGFDAERQRVARGIALRPPFHRIWTFRAQALLEFPPAIAYGRLYLASNHGVMLAVNAETGRKAWRKREGRCSAASPAVHDHVVFAAFLNRPPCNAAAVADGEVVAYAAGFGAVRWRTPIGPSESSPLVANGLVYAGDWRGYVYALDEQTGKVRWRFRTQGRVKGGVAVSGRRLFVASYDHHLYALDARTGKLLWRASAQSRLGFGEGTFYATPTVAYGRVYIGSTDGQVYSFGAATGKLAWRRGTGGYVYSSAAIWRQRVLVGSYSGGFYAFDAATGDTRWRFGANGPISGSPTVIDGVVYFATLKRRTYALDASTGRQLWTFPDGKYSPAVADPKRLYLVGYTRLYGMVEG